MSLTYGEMFAGYGGLGLGVQSVLGGEMAWCAEYEAAPSAILAHHWPDVPNLGDVTKIDWTTVPKVDVITGGSPCQDLSHAGKRAGMKAGTRSGLWASMCDAIEIIRPSLVVWENVRGALSAEADSAMEPCPGCVGGSDDGPVLRALGRVLGDLAELGYDARWYGLRAADVGAPHGRFRIFVFATDASRGPLTGAGTARLGLRLTAERGALTEPRPSSAPASASWHRLGFCAEFNGHGSTVTDGRTGRKQASRSQYGHDSTAPDSGRERHGRGQDVGVVGRVDGDDASQARQRERSREVAGDRGTAATADALSGGRDGRASDAIRCEIERAATAGRGEVPNAATDADSHGLQGIRGLEPVGRDADGCGSANVLWGDYEPAIRRWERVLGRPAPAPTEPGPKGGQRLSPHFVEFLMGLPAGHVTGVKISRNDMLKALGNGVVPQQAAEATRRFLLDAMEAAA